MNGALYDKPLTFFTSSASVLKRHAAEEGHKDAINKECNFRRTYGHFQPDALEQLADKHGLQAAENMKKLESILSCVEFCARQGIPLRGHREHDFSLDPDHMLQRNPGNFLALVRFRSLAGDISLRRDFHQSSESRGYKTTYLSPRI